LLALGQERPETLFACAAALDRNVEQAAAGNGAAGPAVDQRRAGNATVFVPTRHVDRFLRSIRARVPHDAEVVDVRLDQTRGGLIFGIVTRACLPATQGVELFEYQPR
jgi:hypothetical protein